MDRFDVLSTKDVKDLMEKEGLDPVVQIDGNTHETVSTVLRWKPFQHNRINTIIVNHNEQIVDIANYFDINPAKLRKWNDLFPGQEIVEGQNIFLQPKRNKAEDKMHQVIGEQTMYEISQLHGVRLGKIIG